VAAALGALADRKVVLPLRDFARMTKRAEHADAAARLPRVYGRMIRRHAGAARGRQPVRPGREAGLREGTAVGRRPEGGADYSLDKEAVDRAVPSVGPREPRRF
jgi:hypothetical protein